jgi:oligopeptide/dipeptide ABC transporter ATP-binding protein
MGLLLTPPLMVTNGQIIFEDKQDLLKLPESEMQKIRGKDISMIFQEPMTALDPLFTIGEQIAETVNLHSDLSKKDTTELCIEMLRKVGIPRPSEIMNEYPHELSGGMLQRVMIGIAMICNPKLLIADEPTTALDVTIQAQILDLMNNLKVTNDTSILMITHDLGVIAETCDRVAVLYAGQVVEEAVVNDIFHDTMHPYTEGLLKSVTSIDDRNKKLYSIKGMVPSVSEIPKGCRFADRCDMVKPICREKTPHLIDINSNHKCRCWLYEKEETANG